MEKGILASCEDRRERELLEPIGGANVSHVTARTTEPKGHDVDSLTQARDALRRHFAFEDFLEGQGEVIAAVQQGHDTVVVMPTGGGKSLCYQLPALLREGITLVVSPLIALMKDQVDQLAVRGIPTTFINSSLSYAEVTNRLRLIRSGRIKLVYAAPERFRSDAFVEAVGGTGVGLFAVDEAHCISHWGHDFRPDYLRLEPAARRLGRPQMIALTATATPRVRADIARELKLNEPRVFVAGFDRANLELIVQHVSSEREKLDALKVLINGSSGAGIVYAATRKAVEQVAARLNMSGIRAVAYHAGMDDAERTSAQEIFMRGDVRAIVATNAFGMGIDKADIRFVAHYHVPGSLEAYYQEIGRAGRDSLPARCLLLFSYADTRTHQFFIEGNQPPPELIGAVYRLLSRHATGPRKIELSAREIGERLAVKNEMAINSALNVLVRAGHIERGRPDGSLLVCALETGIDSALRAFPDDSIEGVVLRDLVFNRGVNDREQAEIDAARIAAALGVAVPVLRRAFDRLSQRGVLKIRRAHSGRGIQLLDDPPAAPLRINREELAERAGAEKQKLRKMVEYCYHTGCLRQFILAYFGDRKSASTCGSCSGCAAESGASLDQAGSRRAKSGRGAPAVGAVRSRSPRHATRGADQRSGMVDGQAASPRAEAPMKGQTPTGDVKVAEKTVVLKALSCVARMNNRYGKGTVAAVLGGSKSRMIVENGLNRLSTYGLLSDMSRSVINGYIKALVEAGCIAVGRGAYPTVGLTEFGREVMTGRAEVSLVLADEQEDK